MNFSPLASRWTVQYSTILMGHFLWLKTYDFRTKTLSILEYKPLLMDQDWGLKYWLQKLAQISKLKNLKNLTKDPFTCLKICKSIAKHPCFLENRKSNWSMKTLNASSAMNSKMMIIHSVDLYLFYVQNYLKRNTFTQT